MRKSEFLLAGLLALFACLFVSIADSFGAGFGIYAQGSSTFSQADATVAHGDDPSAIFYNPALINQLPGTQVQAGTTFIIPVREFKSAATGEKAKTKSEVFFPSTFYISHAVSDRFSVGFAVFNPFGLGTTWPDDWEGRYIATKSTMTTFAFNPVASLKVAPWLTVAGGVTYLTLDATFERKVNLAALTFTPGTPDGNQKLHGSGNGFGFNLGLLVSPIKDIDVGVSYRSKIHVDVTGNVTFDLPSPAFAALLPNTMARTSIELPPQAYFGIYFKQLYPLTFELSGRWEGWSSFREQDVQFDQPILGSTSSVTPRNWRDAWAGIIGLKYQLSKSVALLGGYQYESNAVPDSTMDPAIPDSNSHYFSVGTDIKYKSTTISFGYGYQLFQKRSKNNAVGDPVATLLSGSPQNTANGDYKSQLHMVALSLTYRF